MTLIIGLGNPGKKFNKTRHNVGFVIVDEFAKENAFPEFKFSKKFNADISKKKFEDNEVILAKPQTYMNESGRSVKKIMSNVLGAKRTPRRVDYPRPTSPARQQLRSFGRAGGLAISNLWVVHDDLDLELGQIKIVKNRGPAGHNGIKSIIENLGTKDFVRFRVGIRPSTSPRERGEVLAKKFVLKKFSREEKKILKQNLSKFVKAIETRLAQQDTNYHQV